MNQQQLMGTAFEYAQISILSARLANDMEALLSLIEMYKRPRAEIKSLNDTIQLLNEYRFTYTQSGLEKFLLLQK